MYTKGDPLLEATGDMKKVKPEEYSAIIKQLSDEGVAIINSNSANRIGYQLREDGKAGTMLWPDEISEGQFCTRCIILSRIRSAASLDMLQQWEIRETDIWKKKKRMALRSPSRKR